MTNIIFPELTLLWKKETQNICLFFFLIQVECVGEAEKRTHRNAQRIFCYMFFAVELMA